MTAPRLEIRLDRIHHNALQLVGHLHSQGISVTAVTKATLGSPDIAAILAEAGVDGLGEPRIETIESLRQAGVRLPITLIRSPMLSQVARVVAHATVSLNTEPEVMRKLSAAALAIGQRHGVVLMVELGDRREGIMPPDLASVVSAVLLMPGLKLIGIGTNLGCQNGVVPSDRSMAELSDLADALERRFGIELEQVSGGNSANLPWLLAGGVVGRINNLRLGESILLGREPLQRQPIAGLFTNAFTLIAEVIESNRKPSQPCGEQRQSAFAVAQTSRSQQPNLAGAGAHQNGGDRWRSLLALGVQDVDPAGLTPPDGMAVLGASSDHLVLDTGAIAVPVGTELAFQVNYAALLRAMTSPFISRTMVRPNSDRFSPADK